jgi:PleD family two-component response regulator
MTGASRLDAERVSRRLAQAVLACSHTSSISIEASFGVAVHQLGETPKRLMARADAALYRTKRSRRQSAAPARTRAAQPG